MVGDDIGVELEYEEARERYLRRMLARRFYMMERADHVVYEAMNSRDKVIALRAAELAGKFFGDICGMVDGGVGGGVGRGIFLDAMRDAGREIENMKIGVIFNDGEDEGEV